MDSIIAIADSQLSSETDIEDIYCISAIKKYAEQHKHVKAATASVISSILCDRNSEVEEGDDAEELEDCRIMAHYWHWINAMRDEMRASKRDISEIKNMLVATGISKEEMSIVLGHLYGKAKEEIISTTEISRDSFDKHFHEVAKTLNEALHLTK